MNRRTFLGAGATAAVGATTAAKAKATQTGSRAKRPNIIHIVPHDLGNDLGCYGYSLIKSPNLDRLASEGVRFTNYFCASTACSPARGTTMTGCYAHTNGLMGLAHLGWTIGEDMKTLVDFMNDAGYQTVHAGLQHERPLRRDHKYQLFLGGNGREDEHAHSGPSTYCDNACGEAIEFLKSRGEDESPFYLNMAFFETHAPWTKREEYRKYKYDPADIDVPAHLHDHPGIRHAFANYYASISYMDEWVGKVLDTLRETGLEEDTIVLFTTDHGRSFPRAKTSLYDPGVNIALIMRWPGKIAPGTVNGDLLHSVDVAPTLLDMVGEPTPEQVQGRSFWPSLSGGGYTPYEHICLERNDHVSLDFQRAIRTRRFKYIRNFTEAERWKLPSEPTEDYSWQALQYSGAPRAMEELYDLEKDPNEFNNVAEDPAYAAALEDMRGRLKSWMYGSHDFLRSAYDFIHHPKENMMYQRLEKKLAECEGKTEA